MRTKNLWIACTLFATISLVISACTPEILCPSEPSANDSIWSDPYDTLNNSGDSTSGYQNDSLDTCIWCGTPDSTWVDSTYIWSENDDSTAWDGSTDSTNFGG